MDSEAGPTLCWSTRGSPSGTRPSWHSYRLSANTAPADPEGKPGGLPIGDTQQTTFQYRSGGFRMKFRPLHDRVVVRRLQAEEKTAGGIIIPDTAKEKPMEGEVVAVGPGA